MKARTRGLLALLAGAGACAGAPLRPPHLEAPAPLPTVPASLPPLAPLEGRAGLLLDTAGDPYGDAFVFSPDGQLAAFDEPPHRVAIATASTGARRALVAAPGDPLSVGFSTDGRAVWIVGTVGAASYSIDGAPLFGVVVPSDRQRRRAAWSPSAELVAALDEGSLRVLDGRSGRELWRVATDATAVHGFSVDEQVLVTLRAGAHESFGARDGARLGALPAQRAYEKISLAPDARTALVVSADNNKLRILDARTGAVRAEHQAPGHVGMGSAHARAMGHPQSYGMTASVVATSWSPSGDRIAVARDAPNSIAGMASREALVDIYDAASGKLGRSLRGLVQGNGLRAWSQDGGTLFAITTKGRPIAWDVRTGLTVKVPPLEGLGRGTPDPSRSLFGVESYGEISVGRLDSGAELWHRPKREHERLSTTGTACGSHVLVSVAGYGAPGLLAYLTPATGGALVTGLALEPPTYQACADGAWLVAWRLGTELFAIDASGAPQHLTTIHHAAFAALSPDGRRVAAIADKAVELYDAHTGTKLKELPRGGLRYWARWSPDGSVLVLQDDQAVFGYDADGNLLANLGPRGFDQRFLDARTLAIVGGTGKDLRLVDARTGAVRVERKLLDGEYSAKAASPDGTLVTDASRVWQVDPPALVATLTPSGPPTGWPIDVAFFSPDGQEIASMTREGDLRVHRARDGSLVRVWRLTSRDTLVGFSKDGAVVVGLEANVRVFRATDGAELRGDLLGSCACDATADKTVDLDKPETTRPAVVLWSLASGHFEGPKEALARVSVFTPGAAGEAFVVGSGPRWERFHDARLFEHWAVAGR